MQKSSKKEAKPEDDSSITGTITSSLIGLGDRVGTEHTGFAQLDSALDSVFGTLSSKVRELKTSPRKEEKK